MPGLGKPAPLHKPQGCGTREKGKSRFLATLGMTAKLKRQMQIPRARAKAALGMTTLKAGGEEKPAPLQKAQGCGTREKGKSRFLGPEERKPALGMTTLKARGEKREKQKQIPRSARNDNRFPQGLKPRAFGAVYVGAEAPTP